MFAKIYAAYEKEVAGIAFACREGCASCCTQSVNMTTAEGRGILAYLSETGRELPSLPGKERRTCPTLTTNGLAACYLEGREAGPEPESPWIYEPCVFLQGERCTIYPARPFGCRSFGSTRSCAELGIAEAPEWFITLNSVVNQLIEHLDLDGFWGNIYNVLGFLNGSEKDYIQSGGDGRAAGLLPNLSVPGFLVPHEEQEMINRFLEGLVRADVISGELLT